MPTLTSALARTARLHGNRPAVLDPEGTFAWEEFAQRVACAAGVLASLGVGPCERHGIVCRNGFRHAELIHAGY